MPRASEEVNPAGRKACRSTHEAAVPDQRLARETPLTVARPTCWPPCTALARPMVTPEGFRFTHEAAVPLQRLAVTTVVERMRAMPTCCTPSVPKACEMSAPEGCRFTHEGALP